MPETVGRTDSSDDLWRYVAPDAYQIPQAPMAVMRRKGLAALWRRFREDEDRPSLSLTTDKTLHALPDLWLSRVAPESPVHGWVAALEKGLALWLNTDLTVRGKAALLEAGVRFAVSAAVPRDPAQRASA